jgi:nucleoid DNA-binding protein
MVELSAVSNLLQQLLTNYSRVSLPGLGAFKVEYLPAVFINEGMGMSPPSKRIYFSSAEIWNDNLLEYALSKEIGCDLEEAKQQLADFGAQLMQSLTAGRQVDFPGLGVLRMTNDSEYHFEAENSQKLNPDAFGLLEIEMTPLQVMQPPPPLSTPPVTISGPAPVKAQKKCSYCWCIWALAIVLVLAVCGYVFRRPISDMIEKAYYTPTEYEYVQEHKNQ